MERLTDESVRRFLDSLPKNLPPSARVTSLALYLANKYENLPPHEPIPYLWGGKSVTTGLDCEGLVRYVFNKAAGDLSWLPIVKAWELARDYGETVDLRKKGGRLDTSNWLPGDLLYFCEGGRVTHAAIYIGPSVKGVRGQGNNGLGWMVAAPGEGRDVRLQSVYELASRNDMDKMQLTLCKVKRQLVRLQTSPSREAKRAAEDPLSARNVIIGTTVALGLAGAIFYGASELVNHMNSKNSTPVNNQPAPSWAGTYAVTFTYSDPNDTPPAFILPTTGAQLVVNASGVEGWYYVSVSGPRWPGENPPTGNTAAIDGNGNASYTVSPYGDQTVTNFAFRDVNGTRSVTGSIQSQGRTIDQFMGVAVG